VPRHNGQAIEHIAAAPLTAKLVAAKGLVIAHGTADERATAKRSRETTGAAPGTAHQG
jgi:hypothetical protein